MPKAVTIDLGRPNSDPQRRFFQATQRYICYGGARGGGKTWAARIMAVLLCLSWADYSVLIIRRTLPELRANIIKPLRKLLAGVAKYNAQEKTFTFPNGSEIVMGYCAREDDVDRYQGHEYDTVILEEATNLTERQYITLRATVRSSASDGRPRHMIFTCNPGGVGHHWVKRIFVDRAFTEDEDPAEYVFFAAKATDNIDLMENDPDYIKSLKALPEKLRRAWLDGDWSVLEGAFFTQWSEKVHVCAPFDVPPHWNLYFAMDYGLDCLAAYVAAVDEQGGVWVLDEAYQSDLLIDQAAARCVRMVAGRPLRAAFAPPDMWNRNRDTGRSLAEAFAAAGLPLVMAQNDRAMGWQEVLRYMSWEPTEGGGHTSPKLHIFSSCPRLIESWQYLLHDERNPDDVAKEPHQYTHGPDAIRYLLSGRPAAATAPGWEEPQEDYTDFLEYG